MLFDEMLSYSPSSSTNFSLTMGEVVCTNDPQQMGRLKISCPAWGDPTSPDDEDIKHIPWSMYVTPFGGSMSQINRGVDDNQSSGKISYGMWAPPKIGATVIVAQLDGNANYRLYMGCVYNQHLPHTLPHGRYINLEEPKTTTENNIEPLTTNAKQAFKTPKSFEWKTRVADYSVSAVDDVVVNSLADLTDSNVPDDKDVVLQMSDGSTRTVRQGYGKNRNTTNPNRTYKLTNGTPYESQVYSWTTPGFHSISMDDRPENCRTRLRTTTGHQLILDDTNERIYLSTNQGKNWVEMDSNGNIDMYSERRISIHSENDLNLSSGGSIRMNAKDGIHTKTDGEYRIHAVKDIHIKTDTNMRIHTIEDYLIQSVNTHVTTSDNALFNIGANMDVNISDNHTVTAGANVDVTCSNLTANASASLDLKGGSGVNVESGADVNVLSGSNTQLTAGGLMSVLGSSGINMTGAAIHMNGPPASPAGPANTASAANIATLPEEKFAYNPNRIPTHEPWSRVMIDPSASDNDDVIKTYIDIINIRELEYDDPKVGRQELGETITRGTHWHR